MRDRTQRVEELFIERSLEIDYLIAMHTPGEPCLWLGMVPLDLKRIKTLYSPRAMQNRAVQWFKLAHSLGNILHFTDDAAFQAELVSILKAFDTKQRNPATQSVRMMKNTLGGPKAASTEAARGPLVADDRLLVAPDLWQVLPALFDVMKCVYQRLLAALTTEGDSITPAGLAGLVEADSYLKHNIIGSLSKELTTLAKQVIHDELTGVTGGFLPKTG